MTSRLASEAVVTAKEIRDRLTNGVSLLTLVEGTRASSVSIQRSDNDSEEVHSLLLPYSGSKDDVIVVRAKLNYCWIRFCVTKELIHLYLNDTNLSSGTTNLHRIIEQARKSRWSKGDGQVPMETFCFLVAVELVIPTEIRGEISDMHHDRALTNHQIADFLKVPQVIVCEYFEWFGEWSTESRKSQGI